MQTRTLQNAHLTSDDIRQIVGDVEDATVAALLNLDLTHGELEAAAKHCTGNSDELGIPPPPLSPRAAQAFDILLQDPAFLPLEPDR